MQIARLWIASITSVWYFLYAERGVRRRQDCVCAWHLYLLCRINPRLLTYINILRLQLHVWMFVANFISQTNYLHNSTITADEHYETNVFDSSYVLNIWYMYMTHTNCTKISQYFYDTNILSWVFSTNQS